jgi:hypothetical protein
VSGPGLGRLRRAGVLEEDGWPGEAAGGGGEGGCGKRGEGGLAGARGIERGAGRDGAGGGAAACGWAVARRMPKMRMLWPTARHARARTSLVI